VQMRFWSVKLGEGGKYVDSARKGNYIAIGWQALGDLRWLVDAGSEDEAVKRLSELYQKAYPNESKVQVSIGVGQVLNFVRNISVGDVVFVPDPPNRKMFTCKVEGERMVLGWARNKRRGFVFLAKLAQTITHKKGIDRAQGRVPVKDR
jgi:predicted Mrr-cat superfamily restriction endonuclease